MKIVELAEFYSERGGGVRSYLDKLLVAGDRLGHEITVIAPGPADEDQRVSPRGRLIRYAAPRMPYDPSYHAPIGIRKMRNLVKTLAPDVVQVSSPFLPAWVSAACRDVPLRSYVYHSDPIGSYVEPFVHRWVPRVLRRAAVAPAWGYLHAVANLFDVVVVAGDWLERELEGHGWRNARTVPFGIQVADFGPEKRDEAFRSELLGPLASVPDARLVLIAGRLAVDKRQRRLVEALTIVAKQRPLGLVLLGDGPDRELLQEAARALPASRWLPFAKDRAEYARILASADMLLHGSVSETYGFVLAETMASGTPLVVPDARGAAALVEPAYGERYDAESRPPAIAEAVQRLLARPRAELSAAARAAAVRLPSMDDHFVNLFALYERLAAERRGAERQVS